MSVQVPDDRRAEAGTPARAPARLRRPVASRRRSLLAAAYTLMAPAVLFFVAFFLLPVGYVIWLSLRRATVSGGGIGLRVEHFIGLGNYQDALADPELRHGLLRLLVYGSLVVPIMLGLALLFALLLDSPSAGARRFSRIAIFLPYAVPGVLATMLWGFLYLPDLSPLNSLLNLFGVAGVSVLGPTAIFGAVANIAIWGGTGFNMIVMYTSLRAISPELYDAARIDGCSEFQLAWRIKIPLLAPALVMTGVFSLIATLQVFNEPFTLRPLANTLPWTWMPMMLVYRDAFVTGDPYLAAATSVVIAAGILVVSLGLLRLLQRRAFGEDR